MKKGPMRLIWVGQALMLVLALLINGCSGGGGGGGGGTTSSTTNTNTVSTPTYAVRGMTNGLLGSGLVLQNNGTDDLEITANEPFRFFTSVKDGSSCTVTILSQPTSPAQTCEVINGIQVVDGADMTGLEIRCLTDSFETFDSGALDSGYWYNSGEYDRKIVNGKLQFNLASAGDFTYDYLPFMSESCGKVSADVAITDTVFNGTGDKAFGVRLQSCSYHTATVGEAPDNRTGDVDAEIIWSGTEAFYRVFQCLDAYCSNPNSIQYLTPNTTAGVPLGTTPVGSTATLSIDWDSILAPGQFTFQLNGEAPKYFNPVAAGAPIDSAVPNMPEKYIGVYVSLKNPDDQAEMTATVDNVTDGILTDNFDNGTYLDGSFWAKTDGRVQVENGQLVLETGQDFVDDPIADNRFNNTTSLVSSYDLIPTGEIVEADITLDPATFVADFGGNPAEVNALLEMEYRPPGPDKKDFTNFFIIRAALKEFPDGVRAEMSAEGCVNYYCNSKYSIANDTQVFATPVVKGQAYRMKIEHMGNGVFDVSMDGNETHTVDLSAIAGFSTTEFSKIGLRTASRRTDTAGEEAFVRALYDNVRVGGP